MLQFFFSKCPLHIYNHIHFFRADNMTHIASNLCFMITEKHFKFGKDGNVFFADFTTGARFEGRGPLKR